MPHSQRVQTMVWKAGYVAGAALVAMLPGLAAAQVNETKGWYLGLEGGATWRDDADTEGARDTEFDNPGWLGGFFGGYDFGGPRLELELVYRGNNPETNVGGYVHQGAAMLNLLYDISIPGFPVTPYIGVGGGYSYAEYTGVDDDDWVFAYQGIAGVSYDITRNISVFVDYRYFGTEDHAIRFAGRNRDIENQSHNVVGGLRYTFGAPPPPPPPSVTPPPPPPPPMARPAAPPPAAVVRSYLVFFDWDRSNLTPEAQRIVQTAATNARSATPAVTRINVTGHADRSGTPQYNLGLSRRRAEAVAAELVRNGVNRGDIAIVARGEAEPLVPTPDGVREPQNRRVEIVLQ